MLLLGLPLNGFSADSPPDEMSAQVAMERLAGIPLDDPTRPPGYLEETDGKEGNNVSKPLVLKEVLVSHGRRVAIVNDQQVAEGEWVDGAQVIAIDSYRVLLRRADESLDLALSGTPVKRTNKEETGRKK